MNIREIDKNPVTPGLTKRAVTLLTELCFRPNDKPASADCIFVFGTSFCIYDIGRAVEEMLVMGLSSRVIVAGGAPTFSDAGKPDLPEATKILNMIRPVRFPCVSFHAETESKSTLENVANSLKIPHFAKAKRIMYVFRTHSAQRGYLTLRKFLPDTELIQACVPVCYRHRTPYITKNRWFNHPMTRSRVWGEFERIEKYGGRGDIHYPSEISELVKEIRKETTQP